MTVYVAVVAALGMTSSAAVAKPPLAKPLNPSSRPTEVIGVVGAGPELPRDSLKRATLRFESPRTQGTLQSLAARKVEVAPGKHETLGAIAQEWFAEHDRFEAELRSVGGRALFGDVVRTTEAIELKDAYMLVRSTGVVVADPNALRSRSAVFRSAITKRKGSVDQKKLTKGSRAGLAAFKKELAKKPAGHPLRKAAAKGDQALLDALANGVGEVHLVDTLVIPKAAPRLDPKGRPMAPSLKNGRVDYSKLHAAVPGRPAARPRPNKPGLNPKGKRIIQKYVERQSDTSSGGSATTGAAFIAGRTWADSWMWEHQWNVPSGFLRVEVGAHYAVGLRVPVEVETTIEPAYVCESGTRREQGTPEVRMKVRARAIDANAAFYRRAGMPEAAVAGGDELALQAGIGYGYKLRLFWETLAHRPYREEGFDWGRDFDPPQGRENERVVDVFLPASVTRTDFDTGPISGSVQFGLRVDVQGAVGARVAAFQGDANLTPRQRPTGSTLVTGLRPRERTEAMTFNSTSPQTWSYRLRKRPHAGGTVDSYVERFGVQVDGVHYDSNWSVVPGVKVEASAEYAGYGIGGTWTFWLDDARIPIGSLELGRHPGTLRRLRDDQGRKIWHRSTPNEAGGYCESLERDRV